MPMTATVPDIFLFKLQFPFFLKKSKIQKWLLHFQHSVLTRYSHICVAILLLCMHVPWLTVTGGGMPFENYGVIHSSLSSLQTVEKNFLTCFCYSLMILMLSLYVNHT
ncbi:hypothetical protein C1646_728820 [Rhizophagus diaphanus]|nr:hypothetical protein C1646_728820 [Rhizophagus diaphanus] [Rhizophagus sp. MUCL 43196]